MSSAVTPVALSGPRFVTTIVKTTSSVTFGVELSTALDNSKSAWGVLMTASSWSSSAGSSLSGTESGSYCSDTLTCAMFVKVPAASTDAVICNAAVSPTFRLPIVQIPVPLS